MIKKLDLSFFNDTKCFNTLKITVSLGSKVFIDELLPDPDLPIIKATFAILTSTLYK